MSAPEMTPPHTVTFIVSFKEVYYYLYEALCQVDKDRSFTYDVMCRLIGDVMETEEMRDPVGSLLNSVIQDLGMFGMTELDARLLAHTAGDLIIEQITTVVPNFGSDAYHGAYEYFIQSPYDVYISVNSIVFTDAQLPSTRTRPYRL